MVLHTGNGRRQGAFTSIPLFLVAATAARVTDQERLHQPVLYSIDCAPGSYTATTTVTEGCLPDVTAGCARYVADNFLNESDILSLRRMVQQGMQRSLVEAGPTILDFNTGLMRDSKLQNIFKRQIIRNNDGSERILPAVHFSTEQFELYSHTFERIHAKLSQVFSLASLYFTAPTFVTRIVGSSSWEPASDHDEYFHPHVDKANTPHYDYSGLLYLSTFGEDFTGGQFEFLSSRQQASSYEGQDVSEDEDNEETYTVEHVVLPRAGRLLLFSAGSENLHRVTRVESGERLVFSMWFTCRADREFATFLDGKAHVNFTAGGTEGSASVRRVAINAADADVQDAGSGPSL